METITVHSKSKKEAIFISELFNKMKVDYKLSTSGTIKTKKLKNTPNAVTRKAIAEVEAGIGLEKYNTASDLFNSLKLKR